LVEYTISELKKLTGQEVGLSEWITIDQDRINKFAKITEDEQFIHVDPTRASQETPFGGTIAHGFLTLSMLAKLAESAQPKIKGIKIKINYGFDKIRFISPVAAGSLIRAGFTLSELTEQTPKKIMTKWNVSIEIKSKTKPAIIANWINLLLL
jgi:acyl dehydratase